MTPEVLFACSFALALTAALAWLCGTQSVQPRLDRAEANLRELEAAHAQTVLELVQCRAVADTLASRVVAQSELLTRLAAKGACPKCVMEAENGRSDQTQARRDEANGTAGFRGTFTSVHDGNGGQTPPPPKGEAPEARRP